MSNTKDPGYASPQEAFDNGPREELLYVTCARHNSKLPDVLATVDVNPKSPNFCKVLHKLELGVGDEVHHSGWNICSSCYGRKCCGERKYLVLPCLNSSRTYVVDVESNRSAPEIFKVIEPSALADLNLSFPHTTHCLANGTVMISTLGDAQGKPLGNFLLLNSDNFEVIGKWAPNFNTPFNYDFTYALRHNVMISSEWGSPAAIKKGFSLTDVQSGQYGSHIHVWDWNNRDHLKSIDLGAKGSIPLEVRFLHNPDSSHGYVGCALGSTLFHFFKTSTDDWDAECVYEIPTKPAKDWILPEMPALVTDILISMDDRFLYMSCWLHGEIHGLSLSDPFKPTVTAKVSLGGSPYLDLTLSGSVLMNVLGGPQMLQLSLDGLRLYVTTSLYSVWDNQFYPEMIKKGSDMFLVDISSNGQMVLNPDFRIDFGTVDTEPLLAHEMRYPGGDCTSDIWA